MKYFILDLARLLTGTIIGKVILVLLAGGLSILGAAPFFDKYISAVLNKYLSIETSDPSLPLGLFLIFIAISLAVWERINQIKIERDRINSQARSAEKPFIDICRRGISVKEIDHQKVFIDIPYCAGSKDHAYNVKLENALITPSGHSFCYTSDFGDHFPDNMTLTNETGRSMHYSLHPLPVGLALQSYIVVKGTYENISGDVFSVLDIFKFSQPTNSWVRAMGSELDKVKIFVETREKSV